MAKFIHKRISKNHKIKCISLNKENQKIKKILDRYKPYGWFSKFVNECLRNAYGLDQKLMEGVYKQMISDKQKQVDDLRNQMKGIAIKLNALKQKHTK